MKKASTLIKKLSFFRKPSAQNGLEYYPLIKERGVDLSTTGGEKKRKTPGPAN